MSSTTITTRRPDREEARVRSIRENMKRDDWRPIYSRPGGSGVDVENVVWPDGQTARLFRPTAGRPFRIVGAEHLGTFSLRDQAARVARGEALRAWEAHTKRSEWADEMTRLEVALDPFIRTNEQGERYIPPHPSLASLTERYGKLITAGLEHGWVEFEKVEA